MATSGPPPARPTTTRAPTGARPGKRPDVDPALERAVDQLRRREFDGAIAGFTAILAREPRNSLAQCNLGIAYMQQKRWREAGKAVLAYLKLESEDAKGYVRLGVIQIELKMFDQAIKSFQNALRWDSKCSQAYRYLGEIYLKLERLDDARDGFKWALRLRPHDVGAICGLAEIYERKNLEGMAAKLYQDGIRTIRPADAGPLYARLGRLLARRENWPQATAALQKAIELGDDDAQTAFELGVAAFKCKEQAVAMTQLVVLESMGSPLAKQLRQTMRI
jgi:tetratricopeptide (TPR) repeat protein